MVIHIRKITIPLNLLPFAFYIALIFVIFSCLPFERITKVRTDSAGNPTSNSCIVNGTVVDIGEEGITQHGHCWSITPNPSTNNDKTEIGARVTPGSYISNLINLAPNQKYYVKAYAIDSKGKQYYGNEISFTTLTIAIPPAPTNLKAEAISKSQINLSWNDNADNEDGFRIERSPDGITSWVEIAAVGATTTTFQNMGLSPSTIYYYRVRAYNAGGNSDFSNIASATTLSDIPIPAAPTNLAADAESNSQITINWTDNSNNEDGFLIERSLDGTNWTEIANVGPDVINFQNKSLTPSTTYYYRVRAYNAGGPSGYTNVANAKTFDAVMAPVAPENLDANAISSSQIELTWADMSDNEEGFKIERAGQSMTWREIDSVGAGTETYLNEELTPSITYHYRVRAYNAGGYSEYSNIDSAKTLSEITVPAAPTDLVAEAVSSSQINLSWTNNADNADGFSIERSVDETNWREIKRVGVDTTTFQNISLSSSVTYYYRVRAYNTGGNSDFSNTANATTLSDVTIPAAPTNLIAEAITNSQINLTWTDNANNEDGFRIERSVWSTGPFDEIAIVGADTIFFQNMYSFSAIPYYYRVRAYNARGNSDYSNIDDAIPFFCPNFLQFTHVEGDVAPVTKTVRYEVVGTNLTGENKCWIIQNLGAHIHANSATDDTEDNAGWYWQFNRKQGYKHDGSIRTPASAWITSISEASDWTVENDPCSILLGEGWRIPTQQEWTFAYFNGGWSTYDNIYGGDLKLHAAGSLSLFDGALSDRGFYGSYWSSKSANDSEGDFLLITSGGSFVDQRNKASGYSIRCIKD
jgi:hypothetical protein